MQGAPLRVGRIPYVNCYPVYGAIDRGLVPLDATLVDGVPTALNRGVAEGALDVSVVSAVEYAQHHERLLLLPDLGITCDGPVRSVLLFSDEPAEALDGRQVVVSASSMTSVLLLELLFTHVWRSRPSFVRGDAEIADLGRFERGAGRPARLVIGDAALLLGAGPRDAAADAPPPYAHVYDLGAEWKRWTGLPFVFAVWVAQRTTPVADALRVHAALVESRDWGVAHLGELSAQAHRATGIARSVCDEYLSGLDWRLSLPHLAGLTEFFNRLVAAGRVPDGRLAFLPAA
ncbi:menaquinone biosynthesis protein [Roseisolibacter sp. H3M3-2]|uniref:menaquinone biosynthetic enzyme MqnA/MqnD family protein n=1 Tax=Roseisolibacter sp. H3M3-2 TaxID=3031323 RepID=UPI0023DA6842|nr:menaquinone biosynthesis protein [Roseisolibacter sp. H3M3-2]MDF1502003.1 menaquinone biosynthesis protein [Roseisolibacter sp. H3M3-2]